MEYPERPVPNMEDYVMSVDNGVYILVTRGTETRKGFKQEYRVPALPVQAVENIWVCPDFPTRPVLNRAEVLHVFGEAKVFTDQKHAEEYAEGVHDAWVKLKGRATQNGVVELTFAKDVHFPKHKQRTNPFVNN